MVQPRLFNERLELILLGNIFLLWERPPFLCKLSVEVCPPVLIFILKICWAETPSNEINLLEDFFSATHAHEMKMLGVFLSSCFVCGWVGWVREEKNSSYDIFPFLWISGKLACKLYENMRREDASIKIQKKARGHSARMSYKNLRISAVMVQTGIRAMSCRKEFRFKKRDTAATTIQVRFWQLFWALGKNSNAGTVLDLKQYLQARWRGHRCFAYYKKLIKAAILTQCRWRGRVARKELRKLKMVSVTVVIMHNKTKKSQFIFRSF